MSCATTSHHSFYRDDLEPGITPLTFSQQRRWTMNRALHHLRFLHATLGGHRTGQDTTYVRRQHLPLEQREVKRGVHERDEPEKETPKQQKN